MTALTGRMEAHKAAPHCANSRGLTPRIEVVMQDAPYRPEGGARSIPEQFGYWLAGLIDGEGSFGIERRPRPGRRITTYGCRFSLQLRADDRAVLLEVVDTVGFGSLHFMHTPSIRARGHHPAECWMVNRRADCGALVALLDRFPLRTKKARDYAIWREAVLYWLTRRTGNGRHGIGGPWTPMESYLRDLSETRRFSLP